MNASRVDSKLTKSHGKPIRPLGNLEMQAYWMHRRNGTLSVMVAALVETISPLSAETLHTALAIVQRQLPMLATHVEERQPEVWLMATDSPQVRLQVLPAGSDWLQQFNSLNNQHNIDMHTGPLWHCYLLNEPAGVLGEYRTTKDHRSVVYTSFCHIIIDSKSYMTYLSYLLKNIDKLLSNTPIDRTRQGTIYNSTNTILMKEIQARTAAYLVYTISILVKTVQSISNYRRGRSLAAILTQLDSESLTYQSRIIAACLSAAHTGTLVRQCKDHAVSVGSALSAAVMLAAVRLAREQGSNKLQLPLTLTCLWPVSLRRYMNHSHDDMILHSASSIYDHVQVNSYDMGSFWSLAKDVHKTMTKGLQNQEPLIAHRFNKDEKQIHEMLSMPSVDLIVNNHGRIDSIIPPLDNIRLLQLHFTVRSRTNTDHSLGTNFFCTVDGAICYGLTTLQGRVDSNTATRLSELVVEVLQAIVLRALVEG